MGPTSASALAWSPDGSMIVAGNYKGIVGVFDTGPKAVVPL